VLRNEELEKLRHLDGKNGSHGFKAITIPMLFPVADGGAGLKAAIEEMRRRCADALAAGYRQVQVKVGTAWREDVERIEACTEALTGADAVIVDANGWWTLADATSAVAALDARDLYVEQPCATTEECAQVRARSRRPLVLDESLTDLAALARAVGAADAVRLKLSQFGGITPIRRARDLAAACGLAMTLEDSGGGDIVSAAAAHLACSVPPRLLLSGFLPGEMVVERIALSPLRAERGLARLPAGAGLGVEVDEAALGEPLSTFE
jgi:L-alanine-DL-glutamate epimerase-like enolase superfamily enzyme